MLDGRSPQARHISNLWWLMLALATVVYLVVATIVVVSMWRRRVRTGDELGPVDAGDATTDRRDHRFLVVGGLVLPIVVLAVVAVQTVRVSNALAPQDAAVHITVDGELWWWRVTYPADGVTTANEIHVPLGERVDLTLRSDNLIHSLWVPQLTGKTDLVPGTTNHLQFTATSTGTFRGQCAEFCGVQHANMGLSIVVQEPADYATWVATNRAPAAAPQTDAQRAGQEIVTTTACAGCHTISGTSAAGTLGPDLSHVGSRSTIAADSLGNDADQMTRWLEDTQQVKPGALMPQLDLTSEQTGSLVAYLQSLK
jgi:cytochrome c oxidase subunit 2